MEEKKQSRGRALFNEYIPYVVTIILVILIKKYVISPIKVHGDSMNNTLKDGDVMILNSISYRFSSINRFDIVVVDRGKEYIIKRVIGLPGEEIEYKDNQLYVNGKKVDDHYSDEITNDFSILVPKDSYFVLGDNRTNSLDSRYFGPFSKKQVIGKTKLTIFPFSRVGNKL